MSLRLLDYFTDVTDPRVERTKLHKLEDILAIAICTTRLFVEGKVGPRWPSSDSANSNGLKHFWTCPTAYPLTTLSDE